MMDDCGFNAGGASVMASRLQTYRFGMVWNKLLADTDPLSFRSFRAMLA